MRSSTLSIEPASRLPFRRQLHNGEVSALSMFYSALVVALLALAVVSLFIGSKSISTAVTLEALLHFDSSVSEHLLVHHLRLPRSLLSITVGIALGIAGVLMQTLTRNPLADPGILGVNAGATLAVVCGLSVFGLISSLEVTLLALLGASLAGGGVYLLAGMHKEVNPVRVVLSGTALSVVLLSATHLITINSAQEVFDQFRHWAVGSLQGRNMAVVIPCLLFTAIATLTAIACSRLLDGVLLGKEISDALGLNHTLVWAVICSLIVILCGSATAAAGPISFIGLTAPHIARFLVGPQHSRLLPTSALIAAVLVVSADIVGRLVSHPGEVSVGIMVAFIGGPCFLYIVRHWKLSQL